MSTNQLSVFPMSSQKITLKSPQIHSKSKIVKTEYNKYLETYATDEIIKIRNSLYHTTKEILEEEYSIFINYKKLILTSLVEDKYPDGKNIAVDKIYVKFKLDDEKKIASYTFFTSL